MRPLEDDHARRPRPDAWLRRMRVLGAALLTVVCASCGSGAGVSAAQTDPTLFVHDVRKRGDDAGIEGYVRYLSDADCFVLESTADGAEGVRNVVVWPPGTEIWMNGEEVAGVTVPERDPIVLGSRVTGGGGYANANTSEIDLPEVPADCLSGGGEFALLHVISAVTPPS